MISRKWHWALSPRPGLGNYSRRLQSVEEAGRHIDAMQSGESWTEEAKDRGPPESRDQRSNTPAE